MTTPKNRFILPDWITGDLLDALNNYFAVRKSKRMMVNQRIVDGRVSQLELWRKYRNLDLVQIVDNASEGNGKMPWLKFYLPKGYVRHEEKDVQRRKTVADSPEIQEKLSIYRKLCATRINWASPIDRATHQERITKALKDWQDAIKRGSCKKLGDLMPQHKPQNENREP